MKVEILQRTASSDVSKRIAGLNEKTSKEQNVSYERFGGTEAEFIEYCEKKLAVLRNNGGGLLLYLDASAWLYPSGLSIADVCADMLGDKDAAVAIDCGGEDLRWNPTSICASQILFNGTEKGREIAGAWKKKYDESTDAGRLKLQKAFQSVFAQYAPNIARIDDYWRLSARKGYFIRQFYLDTEEVVNAELDAVCAVDAIAVAPKKKTARTKKESK